ncbi:MAG: hypothetical protein AAGI03_18280 [Pseudomonadota bacterium]
MQVQQQGEVRIELIDQLPGDLVEHDEFTAKGDYIVSHSESGHHHVLERSSAKVYRDKGNASILYAIVERPTEMLQSAARPHEGAPMQPGIYQMTLAREFDPFAKEARRVAD